VSAAQALTKLFRILSFPMAVTLQSAGAEGIFGLLPIMWFSGYQAGADVTKRIGTPMIGGVITSGCSQPSYLSGDLGDLAKALPSGRACARTPCQSWYSGIKSDRSRFLARGSSSGSTRGLGSSLF